MRVSQNCEKCITEPAIATYSLPHNSHTMSFDVPQACRVVKPEKGTNKTLKLSLGKKKLAANPELARDLYAYMIINGVQYCRPHLLIRCHLCEVDCNILRDQVNEERAQRGWPPAGDAALDRFADKWGELRQDQLFQWQLEEELVRMQNGADFYIQNPLEWQKRKELHHRVERELNDEFLVEAQAVKETGASQCCYWKCGKTQDETKLLSCTGCNIVKYCSEEHQKLDWQWEHRMECTVNVPSEILRDIEEARQQNLRGDYSMMPFG